MKRLLYSALLVAVAMVAWIVLHRRSTDTKPPVQPSRPLASGPAATRVPPAAEPGITRKSIPCLDQRRGLPSGQRLRLIEEYGRVPEDADNTDWHLAQQTTWWGKPIHPKQFWKGRTVWWDKSAENAAKERGRRFPPMPYEDPALSSRSSTDMILSSGGVEIPTLDFHATDMERAFWDSFTKKHPKPPEFLHSKMLEVANRFLAASNLNGITSRDIQDLQVSIVREARDLSYPPEALTPDALFWSYALDQRERYEGMLKAGWQTNSVPVTNLLRQSSVDSRYITDPLAPQQQRAANAWKIAYLQRLRREKTDESYINAYLQAWNLSAAEVFGPTNH